jgi:hypothetical protein
MARARGFAAVEAAGVAIAIVAAGLLLATLPDARLLDALACLRFYLPWGACVP